MFKCKHVASSFGSCCQVKINKIAMQLSLGQPFNLVSFVLFDNRKILKIKIGILHNHNFSFRETAGHCSSHYKDVMSFNKWKRYIKYLHSNTSLRFVPHNPKKATIHQMPKFQITGSKTNNRDFVSYQQDNSKTTHT